MVKSGDVVSPKQVARAIGVSESSLKRWCDQGILNTVRTAGGHRKIAVAEVLRFVREHDQPLSSPEILGLPPGTELAGIGLERGKARLIDALLAGEELVARQVVFDLYLAKHPLTVIFDEVMAAAFHEIGDRWTCDDVDIYQERRGCEIALRVLYELRRMQPVPQRTWPAAGGTIEGDHHALPTAMAEVVLRDAGYHAVSLGTSIPFRSLIRAVEQTRPKLFWVSVSHIQDEAQFVTEFEALSQSCSALGTALAVGGRALHETLRQRMAYSSFGDTMKHLDGFARTLNQHFAADQSEGHRGTSHTG